MRPPDWSPTTRACGWTTCSSTARWRSWSLTGGSYNRSLFPADILDWLPGELVEDVQAPFGEFLADLDSSGTQGAVLRKEIAERIGLNPTRSSAQDLVTALAERGVLRTR